jgi:hypothetical protein
MAFHARSTTLLAVTLDVVKSSSQIDNAGRQKWVGLVKERRFLALLVPMLLNARRIWL